MWAVQLPQGGTETSLRLLTVPSLPWACQMDNCLHHLHCCCRLHYLYQCLAAVMAKSCESGSMKDWLIVVVPGVITDALTGNGEGSGSGRQNGGRKDGPMGDWGGENGQGKKMPLLNFLFWLESLLSRTAKRGRIHVSLDLSLAWRSLLNFNYLCMGDSGETPLLLSFSLWKFKTHLQNSGWKANRFIFLGIQINQILCRKWACIHSLIQNASHGNASLSWVTASCIQIWLIHCMFSDWLRSCNGNPSLSNCIGPHDQGKEWLLPAQKMCNNWKVEDFSGPFWSLEATTFMLKIKQFKNSTYCLRFISWLHIPGRQEISVSLPANRIWWMWASSSPQPECKHFEG